MDTRQQLESAKALVQAQQYDKARHILRTIQHPRQKDWLAQVDRLEQAHTPKKRGNTLRNLMGFIVLLLLFIVWIGAQDQAISQLPAGPTLAPAQTLAPQAATRRTIEQLVEMEGITVTTLTDWGDTLAMDITTTQGGIEAAGTIAGSVVAAYQMVRGVVRPPRQIEINFRQGQIVEMRITIRYTDALHFSEGVLTAGQFFERWEVE